MENIQFVNNTIAKTYNIESCLLTIFQESSGRLKGILVDNELEIQMFEYLDSELKQVKINRY